MGFYLVAVRKWHWEVRGTNAINHAHMHCRIGKCSVKEMDNRAATQRHYEPFTLFVATVVHALGDFKPSFSAVPSVFPACSFTFSISKPAIAL